MSAPIDMPRLLELRRLTRAIDDFLRARVREYVATLGPLVRPRTVLGDFVQGPGKESVRGADAAWKKVVALYEAVAPKAPFHLARDLRPPLDVPGTALEMAPVEYAHTAERGGERKAVTVTKPFEWVLSYSAHGPARLRELIADKNRDAAELQRVIVLGIVLHLVLEQLSGVQRVLTDLRIPAEPRRLPAFGDLPITVLASPVATLRPPDAVVIESTEMTGAAVFQEVVDVDALTRLPDPVRDELLAVLRAQGASVPS
jgi:hypothetical protein